MLNLKKEGKLDISVIKSQIGLYDSELREPMSHCENLQDIFEVLMSPKHQLSFFNYELIKLLVHYGSEEIASDFTKYKRKLQKFFENRIMAQSSGNFVVVIDEGITKDAANLPQSQLQNRINFILGHKNLRVVTLESLVAAESENEVEVTATQKSSLEEIVYSIPPPLASSALDAEVLSSAVMSEISPQKYSTVADKISPKTENASMTSASLPQGTYVVMATVIGSISTHQRSTHTYQHLYPISSIHQNIPI